MKKKHKINLLRIVTAFILAVIIALCSEKASPYVVAALYVIPYLIVGYDILLRSVRNIFRGQIFDENFLMAVATVGAFCLGEYFEAVGVMVFYQTGELFSALAVGKSRRSIAALMDIRPDSARRLVGESEEIVSPEDIAVGDIILVRAGERIALDGTVLEGESTLDLSALTGESLPKDVGVGDRVHSGAVNLVGVIKIRVDSLFSESTVVKILELVENASSKKARSERFITKFARYYTPTVVFLALALAVIPSIAFGRASEWIRRALIFLMVSCPCALVISVPLAFFGGIGGASRKGILIKGATHLEALAKVDTVVFDKTGTLTEGRFSVNGVVSEKISEEELLSIAAHAESESNHPIALSVLSAFGGEIDRARMGEISELAGRGISAVIDGEEYFVGSARLMLECGIEKLSVSDSKGTLHVCRGSEYLGYIKLSDRLKEGSALAISELKRNGIKRSVMLTGDSKALAESVGKELNIDEVFSELLPSDKVAITERLIAEGRKTVFVGDGINDAPVLSRADIGIAMGAIGSDAAIEAADVVIMDDKPERIVSAIKISRKTMRIVRQNVIISLGVKGVILVLGALGYAGMWSAIFGDVGVMVLAILNSMRAMNFKDSH